MSLERGWTRQRSWGSGALRRATVRKRTSSASLVACAFLLAACGDHVAGASDAPPSVTPTVGAFSARVPTGDWTRFDYDAQRSGVGPADTGINAGDLGRLTRRVVHLNGTVDSSPIELHAIRVAGRVRDVIIVTTTYGRTIALDPGTGGKLWEYVPPGIGGYEGTTRFTTASPVADPDRRHVYASSPDGRIRKLVLADGREVRSARWPVAITRDPTKEKISASLNLSGRYVIATTGGYYGDAPSYQGHVAIIDRQSGRLLHVWNSLCSNRPGLIVPSSCAQSGAAIWARQGALVEPGTHRLLVATGNGPFDGRSSWGDSVLELTPDASRLLQNWTPRNQAQLESTDTDIGSTGPALLPVTGGRRLAVQGGKDGMLKLLDLGRLNGRNGGAGPRLGGELQRIPAPGASETLTAPVVWAHAGRAEVFVADDSSTAAYELLGGPRPRLSLAWQTGTPGTSPVLAGGLLYVYDPRGGQLVIRQPSSGRTLDSLAVSPGHWNSPIVVGGRIVVPVGGGTSSTATHGTLYVYHLPGR